MSYGPDTVDQYQERPYTLIAFSRARRPADLPVQAPTKYELVINLKTAKTLGLTVPQHCLPAPTR